MCKRFESIRTVSFLKWEPPSDIRADEIVNVVLHSNNASAALSALAAANGSSQQYEEKSS